MLFLEFKVSALKHKEVGLQDTMDDVDQYERRGTVIISGRSLPDQATHDNPSDQIVNKIKRNLHINMTHSDTYVCCSSPGPQLTRQKKGQ